MKCPMCNLPLIKERAPAALYFYHSDHANGPCKTYMGFSMNKVIRFKAGEFSANQSIIFITRKSISIGEYNYNQPIDIKIPIKKLIYKHLNLLNFQ